MELREGAEGGAVDDEAGVGLPCPLEEIGTPVDDALAEVLGWDVDVVDDFAGGGLRDEDLGVAFAAGALVEEAVFVEEAFSVAPGGVWVFVDDFVSVDGGCGGAGEGEEEHKFSEES